MRARFPRFSKRTAGQTKFAEPSPDVFDQPDRSLLGEALGRPAGFCAALVIVVAGCVFVANHFFFQMKRIDDFALLTFFVGGGVLLSMLLRAGDTHIASQKRIRAVRSVAATEDELVLEEPYQENGPAAHGAAATGLAEAPASVVNAPVPPAALVDPGAVKSAPDPVDDEVTSFQQALVHYVEQGDFHGQGEILRRLGHLAKARGHLKESREFYMNARSCFRKIDDHYAEAAVLLDLGQVLESLDEQDAASAAYRDANRALLDVAMNSGDRYNAVQAHAAD